MLLTHYLTDKGVSVEDQGRLVFIIESAVSGLDVEKELCITGPPCSGKTTIMMYIIDRCEDHEVLRAGGVRIGKSKIYFEPKDGIYEIKLPSHYMAMKDVKIDMEDGLHVPIACNKANPGPLTLRGKPTADMAAMATRLQRPDALPLAELFYEMVERNPTNCLGIPYRAEVDYSDMVDVEEGTSNFVAFKYFVLRFTLLAMIGTI